MRHRDIYTAGGIEEASAKGNPVIAQTLRATHPHEHILVSGAVPRKYREFQNKNLVDLQRWDHHSILRVLRAVSPEASLAITTYLRMFDNGYILSVTKPNGDIHEQATAILAKILSSWEQVDVSRFSMPKSLRHLVNNLALDVLIKGAVAAELVVDKSANPVGLEYIDPWSITFNWNAEETRWIPEQVNWNNNNLVVSLDVPNVFYVPVDPLGNDPYGEEQISSSIQAIIFKCMVMQDLRQAIHTNGWNRLDISVLEEAVIKNIPDSERGDTKKVDAHFRAVISQITDTYKRLNPDDNLVHTDSMKIEALRPGRDGMFDPKALLEVIDNQIANGLATFAVLLSKKFGGGTEGTTSVELILYTKLVAGFQKIVEELVKRALQLTLRLKGIIANVNFAMNRPEIRSDQELAQWQSISIENVTKSYNMQTIGFKEMQQRIRDIQRFAGPVPDDILDERYEAKAVQPGQVERPTSDEDDKEDNRHESNKNRRTGRTGRT